jgi:hypothetical protein
MSVLSLIYIPRIYKPSFWASLYYIPQRNSSIPNSYFPTTPTNFDKLREVNGTNLHFPILLKFLHSTGNIRPCLLGGLSATLNLASNSKIKDDNYENVFRVKPWTTNYELLGLGIDFSRTFYIFSVN